MYKLGFKRDNWFLIVVFFGRVLSLALVDRYPMASNLGFWKERQLFFLVISLAFLAKLGSIIRTNVAMDGRMGIGVRLCVWLGSDADNCISM